MAKAILLATPLLAQRRHEKNWTQMELATLLTLETGESVSESLVQKWESRDRTITSEMALEVARALGVQVLDLVERTN